MAEEEIKGEDVSIEQCAKVDAHAHRLADERDDDPVDWDDVIETPLSAVTEQAFRDQLDQSFEVELGSKDLTLSLVSVESAGEEPDCDAPAVRAPFVVTFQGEGERAVLPEGFYRMRNEAMGEFEVHLEPIPCEDDKPWTPHLQAVFG